MESEDFSQPAETTEAEVLKLEVVALRDRLQQVQQQKADLEVMLETVAQHSDLLITEVQQESQDLQLLIETTTLHADAIEADFYNQAEMAKQQAEEQFQQIAEATPVGLTISCIEDSQFLYVNAAACQLMGLPPDELLYRKAIDFYRYPEDRQLIISALSNEETFHGEVSCLRADHTPFWALVSLRPFIFRGKASILTAMSDITARKQAEQALHLAEERYRSIFENALEGIFQAATDGMYLQVNPALASIYGYDSPEEMMQAQPTLWQKAWVDDKMLGAYKQALDSAGQIEAFEYQCYGRDSMPIWIEENSRIVCDSQGQVLYYEGIVQDITERKRNEEDLKQQVKQLQIEIDQTKRAQEVKTISQTDYFQHLLSEVDSLRISEDE